MIVRVARLPRPNVEQEVAVHEGATVLDVLRAVGVPPDAVVVLRDERPVPVDERVAAEDRLRVLTVFSGG